MGIKDLWASGFCVFAVRPGHFARQRSIHAALDSFNNCASRSFFVAKLNFIINLCSQYGCAERLTYVHYSILRSILSGTKKNSAQFVRVAVPNNYCVTSFDSISRPCADEIAVVDPFLLQEFDRGHCSGADEQEDGAARNLVVCFGQRWRSAWRRKPSSAWSNAFPSNEMRHWPEYCCVSCAEAANAAKRHNYEASMRANGSEYLLRSEEYAANQRQFRAHQIETMIAEFDRIRTDLGQQIEAEEARVRINDPGHFAYPTFAKAARDRREKLQRSIDALRSEFSKLKSPANDAPTRQYAA